MYNLAAIVQRSAAENPALQSYTIEYECNTGNEYDGNLGLRISSIFVIGLGSMIGALVPILAARTKRMHIPPLAFFITKYFGSGVIIATAFIHLLGPAAETLGSPCLTGAITNYSWAEGICLMTIFTMFLIELLAARFEVFGDHSHELEHTDPSHEVMREGEKHENGHSSPQQHMNNSTAQVSRGAPENGRDHAHDNQSLGESPDRSILKENNKANGLDLESGNSSNTIPGRKDDLSYPPGGEDHLGHSRIHGSDDDDHFAAQMTAIFILEFGVIFHSIFIGLTLAVAGSNFIVLYIVLAFHQTFEGLGLGSRLATAHWPRKKRWLPWILGGAYGITTPLAIAIGLGIRNTFAPGSQTVSIVNGVFDAISGGILIYTGLVELMAHEFMFNPEMRRSSVRMMLFAFACMCGGAGVMAVLGRWA
jgi:zinc transporter 1/2/3